MLPAWCTVTEAVGRYGGRIKFFRPKLTQPKRKKKAPVLFATLCRLDLPLRFQFAPLTLLQGARFFSLQGQEHSIPGLIPLDDGILCSNHTNWQERWDDPVPTSMSNVELSCIRLQISRLHGTLLDHTTRDLSVNVRGEEEYNASDANKLKNLSA